METDRAKRSKRQTTTTSNRRLCASAISRFSSGRESFEPLTPASSRSQLTASRAPAANCSRSRVCTFTSWPWLVVETLRVDRHFVAHRLPAFGFGPGCCAAFTLRPLAISASVQRQSVRPPSIGTATEGESIREPASD